MEYNLDCCHIKINDAKNNQNYAELFTNWVSVKKKNLKLFCYRWSEGDGHRDGEDGAQDPHDHDRHLGLVLAGVALQGKHNGPIPAIMAELILRIKAFRFPRNFLLFYSVSFLMEWKYLSTAMAVNVNILAFTLRFWNTNFTNNISFQKGEEKRVLILFRILHWIDSNNICSFIVSMKEISSLL